MGQEFAPIPDQWRGCLVNTAERAPYRSFIVRLDGVCVVARLLPDPPTVSICLVGVLLRPSESCSVGPWLRRCGCSCGFEPVVVVHVHGVGCDVRKKR